MKFLQELKRIFVSMRGTASDTKSVNYTNHVVNHYPYPTSVAGGRLVPVAIDYTVLSGDTVSGTVKVGVHPKGWIFHSISIGTNGLSASAGVGQLPTIGDGTTADKYMLASDFDATAGIGLPNTASIGYAPTADKTIILTFGGTGTPVVGKKVFGFINFIPGA
jgi:hypothetical protein